MLMMLLIVGCTAEERSLPETSSILKDSSDVASKLSEASRIDLPEPTFEDPMTIPGKQIYVSREKATTIPVKIYNTRESVMPENILPSLVCIFDEEYTLLDTDVKSTSVSPGDVGSYNITLDPKELSASAKSQDRHACMVVLCGYGDALKNCKGVGDDYILSKTFLMDLR